MRLEESGAVAALLRSEAFRVSARVFVLSRTWVFLCALFAFLTFRPNRAPDTHGYDRPELTLPFGDFGDLVLGLWSRWDSVWYLGIANHGYSTDGNDPAFFPLYPVVSRALADLGSLFSPGPEAIFLASLGVSLASFAAALYFLYLLVEIDLGAQVAQVAVALVAFFPMALFYQAIYSESLFLLASVGALWFARNDRWALAGAFGAAAAATRSAGILVVVPLLLIYLFGPRSLGPYRNPFQRARPFPLRADALWLLLVPLGLGLYMAYLWASAGDPLRFHDAQDFWLRGFGHIGEVPAGPLGGLWQGISAAFQGVRQIVAASDSPVYWASAGGGPLRNAGLNVGMFLFLVFGLVALVGTFRRLPVAYGAYAAAALSLPLTFPAKTLPLFSLPRFVAVVFPLFIWLAIWTRERGWDQHAVALSAVGLGLSSAQWATWQWVS
jgi:Mannosyltransferase (PIG-V)